MKAETMENRTEKLQFCYFSALDTNDLTDAPASVIWHNAGDTSMKVMASNNPIVEFFQDHDYVDTTEFMKM